MKRIVMVGMLGLGLGGSAIAGTHAAYDDEQPPVRTGTAAVIDVTGEPAEQPLALPRAYISSGATIGLESLLYAGVFVDGAMRLGSTPLYLRGVLERGRGSRYIAIDGGYESYKLGLEARRCGGGTTVCVFGGVDAGVRRAHLVDHEEYGQMDARELDQTVVAPRAGLEVGSRVRGRIVVEVPTVREDHEVVAGFGVTAGVSYAF